MDLIIISLKINFFSPRYSWKIAELALKNNHSLTQSLRSEFRVVVSVTISAYKRCYVRLYLQLFVGGLAPYSVVCFIAYSGTLHDLSIWVLWRVYYKRQGLLTLRERLGSPSVFGGVRVSHIFSFLCCVFCFVCLRPVSCVVLNVTSVSGLAILDCLFSFLWRFSIIWFGKGSIQSSIAHRTSTIIITQRTRLLYIHKCKYLLYYTF